MKPGKIRVIAICPFYHQGKILVLEGFDSHKQTKYCRPLGGGVDVGETSETALRREISEELGLEITGPELLTVIENLFTLEGTPGHEIVFVYQARFVDESAYRRESFTVREINAEPYEARWRTLDSFDDDDRLVPAELIPVLAKLAEKEAS